MTQTLDHGIVNLPLGHRARGGSLDRHIDNAVRAMKAEENARHRATFHSVREKKARIKQLLADLSDDCVMKLAAPLGARKPSTARAALYYASSSHLDRWISALEREAA